jgi:hypothetical protein
MRKTWLHLKLATLPIGTMACGHANKHFSLDFGVLQRVTVAFRIEAAKTRPAIFKWRQTEARPILCAVRWYHFAILSRYQSAALKVATHPPLP